jgi:translation initiation factor IF-3
LNDYKKKEYGPPVNLSIRAKKVIVIDKDNNNIGTLSISEAIKMAQSNELDLVQVSKVGEEVPTCRILDYGKYKYEQDKKKKNTAKKQRESLSKIKEIKLRPTTDINDLKIKAAKTEAFINEGHRVKITVVFKGRELSHREIGYETLNTFVSLCSNAESINSPAIDGRILSTMLSKKAQTVTQIIAQ